MKSLIAKAFVLCLVLSTFGILLGTRSAFASVDGFNPGRIMDDSVMSNKTSMSESEIQSFLKSKNSCNDRNLSKLSGYNSTSGWLTWTDRDNVSHTVYYNLKDGHFVCLADETFNGESAAHIIWQTSQDYNINPQVLLVLLEKEQSLITDTWPNSSQYTSATGFACYDNGTPCQGYAAGFKVQVRKAANLFHEVLDNRDYDNDGLITNYPVGINYVRYNPDSACGGTNLNIQNRATSALYRYTPYQPNAYALGGGGISSFPECGAFGNRNFYDYFTAWFGGTRGPEYSAQPMGQSYYPVIPQGQKATSYISYKNTGNAAWFDDVSAWSAGQKVVKLGTDNPLNRSSLFGSDWRWGPTRATDVFAAVYEADGTTLASNQHVAYPGQIAKFSFNFSAPINATPGFYGEAFRPIVEGVGPMNPTGTWLGVTVVKANYSAQPMGQSYYPVIPQGQKATSYISYKNTGNAAWFDDVSAWSAGQKVVKLGTDNPLNRSSLFGSDWRWGPTRATDVFAAVYEADGTTLASNQHVAYPGQIAKFSFNFSAPINATPGFYGEAFRPIVEGVGPMNPTGTWLGVTVVKAN